MLLVGKTVRTKTWADIQPVKNGMLTQTKQVMGHNVGTLGTIRGYLTTTDMILQIKDIKSHNH